VGDVNGANTCLKAASGELVCLRRIDKEKREVARTEETTHPSNGPLSALFESREFPEFDFALQLIKVTPGSELGAMDRLRAEQDVIAVTLNYIGEATAPLKLRKPAPRRNEWWMLSDKQEPSASPHPAGRHLRVLVIDVEPSHCQRVMKAVAVGARAVQNAAPIEIIGRSLDRDGASLATLHEYVTLLLHAASIGGCIVAINMSVDWGVACDHGAPLANEVSTVSVSFPFFEHILARVHRYIRGRNASTFAHTPAFFAAAGNQRGGTTRWRMAYPAVLPNVFAATFVSPVANDLVQDEALLSPRVDCPAVFDVKPCFGVNTHDLPEDLREGSSFACAWLAGYYAALASSDSDGVLTAAPMFSKTALLQNGGSVLPLTTSPLYWARPSVSIFKKSQVSTRPSTSLASMLAAMNKLDADVEFVVTGSMAMVDVLLSRASRDWTALQGVSRAFGDIDVVQSAPLPPDKQVRASQMVLDWLEREPRVRDGRLDLCLLERRLSAPMLAQCIVPASQVLITAGGVVDATGGQKEIAKRQLSIQIPDSRRVWDLNPQFLSEAAGMALGILIWIDLSLVMQIASHALGLNCEAPLDYRSANSVRAALAATASDIDAQQRAFGGDPAVGEARLSRRIARAHMLLRTAKHYRLEVSSQIELVRLLEDAPVPS
jgi:hypothetical protein